MKIAIIDDQDEIRFSVSKILKKGEHELFEFKGNESSLDKILIASNIQLIILDVMLETEKTGIDLLKDLRKENMSVPVILMTAFTTPENLIEASKLGIHDILQKPFEKKELLDVIAKYEESCENQENLLYPIKHGEKKFIGSFETMKEVYKEIGLCSNNDFTVLVNGETGTGKELVATMIHESSNRATHPFIPVNCASIPNELFESLLFGHEKGSFTSAEKQHIGFAEQVGNGTLFLDEIGEIDISLQSKLLRFLENRTFRRVGGSSDILFKGRIIAATNIDLEQHILANKFREDLYFRLSMITITIPNLNQRKEDIPLLVEHFIKLANKELKCFIKAISNDALTLLSNRKWDGNIRELRNTIYHAVLNAKQDIIHPIDLNIKAKKQKNEHSLDEVIDSLVQNQGLSHLLDVYEYIDKTFYKIALTHCSNITKLSEHLNISRLTLRKTLQKYDLYLKIKELQ